MVTRIVKALREALDAAEAEIQRLEKELDQLRAVRQGLAYAIDREQMPKARPHSTAENGWGGISRNLAVEKLLREVPTPLSPAEIAQELAKHGRTDPSSGVSAALSRLKTEERVVQVGFGKWTVPTEASDEPNVKERLDESAAPRIVGPPTIRPPS